MAEFVQVGAAYLFPIGGDLLFGIGPDVFQKKQDLGRQIVDSGEGFREGLAYEKA